MKVYHYLNMIHFKSEYLLSSGKYLHDSIQGDEVSG